MKVKKIFRFMVPVTIGFLVIAATFIFIGCGDDSSGRGQQTGNISTLDTTFPISNTAPISLLAGEPETLISFHVDLPQDFDFGQLSEAFIDLEGTLQNLTILRVDGGTSPDPTVDFTLRVAAGDDPGACTGGTQALRMEVVGNEDFSSTDVSVDEGIMPQSALDILNSGNFTLCGTMTSSVDADLTFAGIDASFGFGENGEPPQDMAGVWGGTYYCDDVCDGISSTTPMIPIELTITQSEGTAIYWSDSAVYIGSVSGASFRHIGFGPGYFEYGTFTLTGDTTAEKISYWESLYEVNCGGTCYDDLTLSP